MGHRSFRSSGDLTRLCGLQQSNTTLRTTVFTHKTTDGNSHLKAKVVFVFSEFEIRPLFWPKALRFHNAHHADTVSQAVLHVNTKQVGSQHSICEATLALLQV